VDEAIGWARLLRVRGEVATLADLADEDPLLRAIERWRTLRKFAPDLIAALEFRAVRVDDPMLASGAAGGPQQHRPTRGAARRADAVPQGVATLGDDRREAGPAALRDSSPRDIA
jgi:hypothetical protein